MRSKDMFKAMAAAAQGLLPDALLVGGAGAVSYGAYLVMPAVGCIVGGGLALIGGYLLSRSAP